MPSWSGDLLRSSVLESLEDGRPVDTVMMSQWHNGRYVIGAQGGVMIVVDSESLKVLNVIKMVGYLPVCVDLIKSLFLGIQLSYLCLGRCSSCSTLRFRNTNVAQY